MIRVREMYVRVLREFVTRELGGLTDWPAVRIEPAEEHERWVERHVRPDRPTRQHDGRWREMVRARIPFGDNCATMISIRSPNDCPPLGEVAVHGAEDIAMAGPMEPATWEQIGARLRERFGKG